MRSSFSSLPTLFNIAVQEIFGPQVPEYGMGLSLGQSSSAGKPITLGKMVKTGEDENIEATRTWYKWKLYEVVRDKQPIFNFKVYL